MQTEEDRAARPTGPMPTLFEAIVRRLCVTATYNKVHLILAPHILYTRHGAPYVDAVAIARDGKTPKEEKMGAFKVDGLSDISITIRLFTPSRSFLPESEKYDGTTLMKVDG